MACANGAKEKLIPTVYSPSNERTHVYGFLWACRATRGPSKGAEGQETRNPSPCANPSRGSLVPSLFPSSVLLSCVTLLTPLRSWSRRDSIMIRTITTSGSGMAFLLWLQLLFFLPKILANEATPCYAPDTTRRDDRFMPCISMEGMDSMCCRLNDHDPDICKPNGLCYWENVDGGGRNGWYRGLCTSQDWDTPNCLPKTICTDDDVR